MRRRDFLKIAGAAATSAGVTNRLAPAFGASSDGGDRPNILIILTDQQFGDAMSCRMGRKHLHTPNMDSIAENGMLFSRAYCANPLCVPSRSSMFTGRYPHQTGIQTNSRDKLDPNEFVCMGRRFDEAGYDTGFVGKWHNPYDVEKNDDHGFRHVVGNAAIYDGRHAADFIEKDRDDPFLLVASFMNPHNICEWSRGQNLPGGAIGDPPPPEECPPLKLNHGPARGETDIIAHMRKAYQSHRLFPVGDFSPDKWRQYLWAYYRLVEKVDRQIGVALDALRESGQEENTVIVFLSDHGECHGVHGWNQKTVFYDEASRVPMIISRKGVTPTGGSDALVNTGVDLMPTVLDFAGIETPTDLPGRSLKPLAMGRPSGKWRDYVVSQDHLVQCEPVDGVLLMPEGRMVRSDRYKYCLYSEGLRRESLVDMTRDPGEMINLAADADARAVLLKHRELLTEFADEQGDKTALGMLEAVSKGVLAG